MMMKSLTHRCKLAYTTVSGWAYAKQLQSVWSEPVFFCFVFACTRQAPETVVRRSVVFDAAKNCGETTASITRADCDRRLRFDHD
jgi:hypothetical protein